MKWKAIRVAVALAGLVSVASADVITIPGAGTGNNATNPISPLTIQSFAILGPDGLLETISASLFLAHVTGPIQLNSVALRADPTNTATGPETADLNLTVNGATAYSGAFTFQTANTGLFDMVVTFSSPIVYDPNTGDLVLGVAVANDVPNGSSILPDAFIYDTDVSNGLKSTILGGDLIGSGLILQFDYTPVGVSGVPEPGTFVMMGGGLLGLAYFLRSRRRG